MFLLKRIALAAAMSCCSESAIAQVATPAKAEAKPADAATRQIAEAPSSTEVVVVSTPVETPL